MGKLTDEQIIARIRWAERYGRPLGLCMLVIGIVSCVVLFYVVNNMRERSLETLSEFRSDVTPTTQEVQQSFDNAQFYMGFALGSAFVGGVTWSCSVAVTGLFLMLPRPKDRLLLRCWEKR